MKRRPKDALDALLACVLFGSEERQTMKPAAYNVRVRRLVRALRKADYADGVRAGAEYIVSDCCDCPGRGYWPEHIPAAVLSRPARRKGARK